MIRDILQAPDKRLEQPSGKVTDFGDALAQLVADMADTMASVHGVGIAAIQIGVPLRVFLIRDEERERGYSVYVNPFLLTYGGKMMGQNEGCLSVAAGKIGGVVVRPDFIEASWYGLTRKLNGGKLRGLNARIFLHELDHLAGNLYTLRVVPSDYIVGDDAKVLRQ